jgi:hypothetical protein
MLGFTLPAKPPIPLTLFDNLAQGFPFRGIGELCLDGLRC